MKMYFKFDSSNLKVRLPNHASDDCVVRFIVNKRARPGPLNRNPTRVEGELNVDEKLFLQPALLKLLQK